MLWEWQYFNSDALIMTLPAFLAGVRPSLGWTLRSSLFHPFVWLILVSAVPALANPDSYQADVERLGYSELSRALSTERVWALAGDSAPELDTTERRALAVLRLLDAPEDPVERAAFIDHANARDTAYLGRVGEPSILPRVAAVWSLSERIPRTEFATELRALIAAEVANGYNITTTRWPGFRSERHLVYGHNDIRHAQQLLALMASEGLEAKVGFSLKASAFVHRDDWGPPSADAHALAEGRHLNEVQEFDLHFEFPSREDKGAFRAMVDRYAKREESEQSGLIYSAWWQPYYRSRVPEPGFYEVTQVLVSQGEETAVVLVLPEKAPELLADVEALGQPWELATAPVWVNPAFYRYLQGDYR